MNSQINLVANTNDREEREKRILLVLRITAVSMLITMALVSVLLFIISTQISVSEIKQQENTVNANFSALSKKLALYGFAKDRLKNINNILSTRRDFTKPINTIYSKLTSTLVINGISINDNSVKINVSGKSLTSINNFINNMGDLNTQKKIITNLQFNGLSLNPENGNYSINFTMDLL